MGEEHEICPARRGEVAEVVAGQGDVRVLVRWEVVRELERPPVGLALVATEERGKRWQADHFEDGEEQERDGEVARLRRPDDRPEGKDSDRSRDDEQCGELRGMALAPMAELVRDDQLQLGLARLFEERVPD